MYQCRKLNCLTCKFVQHKQKYFTTKDKTFELGQFFNCSTEFVVYCLSYPCNLLYVGRTTRTLRKKFGEQRRSIEDNKNVTIPRHFTEFHQGSTNGLRVWIIEAIPNNLPRAERIKHLRERETFWIYTLDCLKPGGLNEEMEAHSIL